MRRTTLQLSVTTIFLLLVACGDDSDASREPPAQFVGALTGSDAFIGVARNTDKTLVYVCDGNADAVTIAEWLLGSGGATSFGAAGGVQVALDSALPPAGTVTLGDGSAFDFTTAATSGGEGMFRAVIGPSTDPEVAGSWLVAGGAQRGALRTRTMTTTAPPIETSTPTVSIGGVSAPLLNVDGFFFDFDG